MRKESPKLFIFIIFIALCLIPTIPIEIPQRQAIQVSFLLLIILSSLLGIIEHGNKSEMKSVVLGISVVIILTLGLIAISAASAPWFFKLIGFTVNDANNTSDPTLGIVSASDATGIFSSSIFTAVIAYIFWELEKNKKEE